MNNNSFTGTLNIYNGTIGVCTTMNVNKSCRGCNKNISGIHPAILHQKQKIIQNTVRIQSSLYTMNLASLSSHQSPSNTWQQINQSSGTYYVPPDVNWNQMSDRSQPSKQLIRTITKNRPSSMSAGGVGVDIKHNSYERRLNKLKGKHILKRGNLKTVDGQTMQGGKMYNMGIISGCNCSSALYPFQNNNNTIQEFNDAMYTWQVYFKVGETILVRKNMYNTMWYKGIIISIDSNILLVDFGNENVEEINSNEIPIIPYFKKNMDCVLPIDPTNPADLLEVLKNNQICEKEKLLESGILI